MWKGCNLPFVDLITIGSLTRARARERHLHGSWRNCRFPGMPSFQTPVLRGQRVRNWRRAVFLMTVCNSNSNFIFARVELS